MSWMGGAGGESTVLTAGGMHGFAPALTSFVGRAKDIDALAGLLGRHRLVTVAGPGGAGKSRLTAELAARVAGQFTDGVWLVELAPVRDPALVPAVVAAALGIPEQAGVPTAGAVARVLCTQQLLLVLDNCEQVIGAAAALCAGLLAACDDVRLLTTSQEPLRVAGEARYRLAPLPLPGPDDPAGTDCEAAVLFADRARHADARFELDEETRPAVARLVRRLDGMPLAIELAAAQAESLGVTQLLDRIDDRFRLLAGADRLAPSRQQSLAATVEWSYRLLDEREQQVFRLVSLFPGPFTLEAAEAVAGDDASKALLRLVDCSLVAPPRPGPDGESRYSMLETLRAYGAGLLAAAGEQPAAAAALAGYALRVAEQAASGLDTISAEVPAARLLDAEDATMQQALAWAMAHEPAVGGPLAHWGDVEPRGLRPVVVDADRELLPVLCDALGVDLLRLLGGGQRCGEVDLAGRRPGVHRDGLVRRHGELRQHDHRAGVIRHGGVARSSPGDAPVEDPDGPVGSGRDLEGGGAVGEGAQGVEAVPEQLGVVHVRHDDVVPVVRLACPVDAVDGQRVGRSAVRRGRGGGRRRSGEADPHAVGEHAVAAVVTVDAI